MDNLASSSNDLATALSSIRPGEVLRQPDVKDDLFKTRLAPSVPVEAKLAASGCRRSSLERCRAEQNEILTRSDVTRALCVCGELVCTCPGVKAWLVVLGMEDWECEKRFIEAGA